MTDSTAPNTTSDENHPSEETEQPLTSGTPVTLSNEFAFVEIGIVRFGNGERLAITSPSRGTTTYLDPVVLEVLSALDPAELRHLVAHDLDQ